MHQVTAHMVISNCSRVHYLVMHNLYLLSPEHHLPQLEFSFPL